MSPNGHRGHFARRAPQVLISLVVAGKMETKSAGLLKAVTALDTNAGVLEGLAFGWAARWVAFQARCESA